MNVKQNRVNFYLRELLWPVLVNISGKNKSRKEVRKDGKKRKDIKKSGQHSIKIAKE